MSVRLSRRTMLTGLGGVAIGLPVLDCMLNDNGDAQAQSGDPLPLRYAIVFAGQSLGGDGWERHRNQVAGERFDEDGHFIVPASAGAGWEMTTPLEPLAGLRDDFSIVSGMEIPFNANSMDASGVPAGGAFRDFHGGGAGPLLCGTRSESPSFTCRSITSDQVVAKLHAGKTNVDSLVLRAQPSWYLSGSSYAGRQYISYGDGGSRIESQPSPQIAFRSLFSGFTPDDPAAQAQFDFNKRARKSVLDLITRKRQRILSSVGSADRIRLERHFDELRNLEQRIDAVAPRAEGSVRCLRIREPTHPLAETTPAPPPARSRRTRATVTRKRARGS